MVRVVKEFQFDCAHMLTGHEALCKNLHGHTYKLQVELEGDLITEGSSEGMVIDFSHLKKLVKSEIVDVFDHAFIYWIDAPENSPERRFSEIAESYGLRAYGMACRPTAENMSVLFFNVINNNLKNSLIKVTKIRLWETPTSFVEYTG